MGTKRIGLARSETLVKSLLQRGFALRKKAGAAGTQEDTTLIIGRGGDDDITVNPYAVGTTQLYPLGAKLIYNDREYRYAKAGATIPAGNVVQSRIHAHATHHRNMNVAAAAIGATEVTVTTGGTSITANEYAGGYLYVNDGTGEGLAYKIKSHPARSGAGAITITLYDPITVALVGSGTSEVSLAHNKYTGVIKSPGTTPMTGESLGVASSVLADGEFFWVQTKGPAAVLVSGAVVVGDSVCVTISGGTAGAVIARIADEAAQRVSRTVGQVLLVNATTEYSLIDISFE